MSFLGRTPSNAPLTTADIPDGIIVAADLAPNSVDSSELVDGSIDTSHIADNQVTLAKMAGGIDGRLITYDTSGDPAYVATGTSGHVLTSAGADAVPAFAAIPAAGIDCDADSWLLHKSGTSTYSGAVFDFDVQEKLGSNVTESAGTVTIATAGWYYVYWKLTDHNHDTTFDCYLRLNGTNVAASRMYAENASAAMAFGYYGEMMARVIEIASTNTLEVWGSGNPYGEGSYNSLTWFGGFRLGT